MATPDMHGAAAAGGSLPGRLVDGEEGLATWVALFYDLVFVAAILIFTRAVEHIHPQTGAFWIVAVFIGAWWIWYSTTLLAHRLQQADLVHRLLLLVQMLVIVLMAMEARVSVDGDSRVLGIEYAVLLATVSVMYLRAWWGTGPGGPAAGRLAAANLAAALVVVVGVLVPEPARLVCYLAALAVSMGGTAVPHHGRAPHGDGQGGEAFIESALALSGATIHSIDVVSLVFEFVLVFALFSAYFGTVPPAGIDPGRFRPWSALHLVLQIAVAASAVSVTKLIADSVRSHVPDAEILRLTVPLVAFYLALAGLVWSTRRRPVAPLAVLQVATATAVAVVGTVAWFVPWIHLDTALPLLDAVAVSSLVVAARVRPRTRIVGTTRRAPA